MSTSLGACLNREAILQYVRVWAEAQQLFCATSTPSRDSLILFCFRKPEFCIEVRVECFPLPELSVSHCYGSVFTLHASQAQMSSNVPLQSAHWLARGCIQYGCRTLHPLALMSAQHNRLSTVCTAWEPTSQKHKPVFNWCSGYLCGVLHKCFFFRFNSLITECLCNSYSIQQIILGWNTRKNYSRS